MKLNNWAVVRAQISPYQAPEQAAQHLTGKVAGHPKFPEEHEITTSAVRGKRMQETGTFAVVTRSDSVYELGEAAPEYEALYPFCRERLINSLPEV